MILLLLSLGLVRLTESEGLSQIVRTSSVQPADFENRVIRTTKIVKISGFSPFIEEQVTEEGSVTSVLFSNSVPGTLLLEHCGSEILVTDISVQSELSLLRHEDRHFFSFRNFRFAYGQVVNMTTETLPEISVASLVQQIISESLIGNL